MLTFNGINVTADRRKILDNITFSLAPHKLTAVIGRNGSGKSTLVSCVTGLVSYTGGILYGEKNTALIPPRERAQLIAVLPQLLPAVSLTVSELAAMGRAPYLDIGRRLSDIDRRQIENALEITGMSSLSERRVSTLSGGERQKAYLAMILAQNTRIIILDEPTTYMAMENEAEFLELLRVLETKHKKTVMIVMHDLTKAVETADNILVLNGGRQEFFGSSRQCAADGVIERVFGVRKSVCEMDGEMKTVYYR